MWILWSISAFVRSSLTRASENLSRTYWGFSRSRSVVIHLWNMNNEMSSKWESRSLIVDPPSFVGFTRWHSPILVLGFSPPTWHEAISGAILQPWDKTLLDDGLDSWWMKTKVPWFLILDQRSRFWQRDWSFTRVQAKEKLHGSILDKDDNGWVRWILRRRWSSMWSGSYYDERLVKKMN